MTALPGDRDVQIERIAAVLHGAGVSKNVPGTAFVRPMMCKMFGLDDCPNTDDHKANATALYDAGLRVEAEPVGGLEAADLRELREGVQQGTAALAIVYPVIQALRTWRDAKNTPKAPRAIQEAEQRVLTELQYFEDRAALALGSDK